MRRGFTLIEILVAVGLLVLMVGMGSVSFQQANKRQQVDQTTERLRQAFRQAKSNALAGKKDCLACGAAGGGCGGAGETPFGGVESDSNSQFFYGAGRMRSDSNCFWRKVGKFTGWSDCVTRCFGIV